uniref:Uncharacterized protein n=1 Tax=Acrobeloides nanus TaxID=290746 RepID=A0A914DTG8_9BILA
MRDLNGMKHPQDRRLHAYIMMQLDELERAKDNDSQTVLHWAAHGNLDVVQWLVEHGKANVDATDNYGRTVLNWAARDNLNAVQWLVEHGKANVDATDNKGQTVLLWAAQENEWDVVKWLVEHGKANVEATDNYGQTVLHWAARDNLNVVPNANKWTTFKLSRAAQCN